MFTVKTIEELNEVINNSKDWKAQHAAFGTHLPKKAEATTLSSIAHKMLRNCELWKAHWQKVLDDRKAELDKLRGDQLASKAKTLAEYDDDQWEKLCKERARLRGLAVPAEPNN
jgi:hypothetical protein